MRAEKTRKLAVTLLGVCLLTLLLPGFFPANTSQRPSSRRTELVPTFPDPLGDFEGPGAPGSISWTGDGNRINNPSFEEGSLSPWIPIQDNAAASSSATISKTSYDGKNSTQLSLLSGNLTRNSYFSLLNDLTQTHVGFSSSVRFRAALMLQQLTGTNVSDRAEISISLTSSIGLTRTIHYVFAAGSSLPANIATDAYYNAGPAPVGQWATVDRNLASDASSAFPGDYPTVNSVAQVTLNVLAQTQPGPPNHDPHIKYWNFNTTQFHNWQSGLTVVYDLNNNGVYDDGDYVLGGCYPQTCSAPPTGTLLTDDPLIRYVDSNNNNVWDPGESVVYDGNSLVSNNEVYDYYDPVIAGPTPPVGTLLIKIVQNHTSALFDMVDLYSATGGSEWIKNGGFETGLTGWEANSSFATSPFRLSGAQSALGTITNGAIEMAQSIDGKPLIDSSTIFKASANITTMSGTSPSNTVDIWLGLVDSQYKPASLYFVFKTGDGSLPNNRTNTVFREVSGFGTLNQWLTLNTSLSQETAAFNLLGYSPPYSVEVVVVEVTAQSPSSTTTAYFDGVSIRTGAHAGTAPSSFYAVDGLNTTYVYTADMIPQGSLHLEIPGGETILNITSPERTMLQQNEYTTALLASCTISPCIPNPRAVDIPDGTLFKHAPVGNWQVFATSTNTIANVYVEDPASHNAARSVNVGSTVNLVSQIKDPFGQPLSGVPVTLSFWNSSRAEAGSWTGSTNALGWWNVSSLTLPLSGSPPGVYSLQAAMSSPYPGIRTFQVSVIYLVAVTLTLSSTQTTAGSSITISGTVTQAGTATPAQGVNVTISYRLAGNSQWTVLGTVKTDASGKYSYNWKPPEGEYEIMTSTGDTQTAPAESTRTQLIVGPAGFLQGPWPLVIAGVTAATVIALVAIALLRRRPGLKGPN